MVLYAFEKPLCLPHLVRCLSSKWIQLIQDLRDFLSNWCQQSSHWCVSVNLVLLWRKKAWSVNEVLSSRSREGFHTYMWWLSRTSHATLKIKTKITCDLLATVSRFLSPWLGFFLRHTIGSFECQWSMGLAKVEKASCMILVQQILLEDLFQNRVLMRRNINASYEHTGVNIVRHTFVVIVKCRDNLPGEISVPDHDFVKRCFRKVFLVSIFLWPYRELSE